MTHLTHPADIALLERGGVSPIRYYQTYDCCLCNEESTGDETGVGLAIPFGEYGQPISSREETDMYNSVCQSCYNRWEEWDNLKGIKA